MKKGQIISMDLFVAFIVVLIIMQISLIQLSTIVDNTKEIVKKGELERVAILLSDELLNNPTQGKGLAVYSQNRVSTQVINSTNLDELDLEEIQKKTERDFLIKVKKFDGSLEKEVKSGKAGTTNNIVVRRIVFIDEEAKENEGILEVQVWE